MTQAPFLCIFALPKPFRGTTALQQCNAIASWVQLGKDVEVLLCGDDEGVADAASRFHVRHEPNIPKTELGTPLVSGAFEIAQRASTARLLCYVNSDIVLMSDFGEALRCLNLDRFLLCGRRWDLDLTDPLPFESPDWELGLREACMTRGQVHAEEAMDYFAFPRGMIRDMPPFVVGRAMWDNWLVFHARALRVPVIDSTRQAMVVHQNHDYTHTQGGVAGVWFGPEASVNRQLAQDMLYPFTLADATHILDQHHLARPLTVRHAVRMAESAIALYVQDKPRSRRLIRKLLRAKDV